ncbi:MAG: AAA family ATPase [Candidatus Thorarchaeota archaeon]|jgi:predicted ATPase
MRISNLKISKLRCFSDFELSTKNEEPEIIFLAGENGSGKSTILWALAAGVTMVLSGNRPSLPAFSDKGDFVVEVEYTEREGKLCNYPNAAVHFKWENGIDNTGSITPSNAGQKLTEYRKRSDNPDRTEIGSLDYLPADRFTSTEQTETLKAVTTGEVETRSSIEYLNLTNSRRSGRRTQSKYRDALRQYGTLLQTDTRDKTRVYDHLQNKEAVSEDELKELVREIDERSHFERIKKAISKYLPRVTLGNFYEQSENPPTLILKTPTDESIELAQLSSGEFQMVVWMIDLIQKDLQNSIILWDEPEQHLHPSLSMKIPDMLREFCPGSQIWIATQSPFIISSARPLDRVCYLERDENGTVQLVEEANSKIQSFRRLTPNGFLATWGKQVVFVEGVQDVAFFQDLLNSLDIDAIAASLTSKPSLDKLDSILQEMKDRWGVPIAIAVVDRDYHHPDDFGRYPLITYYSERSCDLEGLLLEPDYMNNTALVSMAKEELSSKNVTVSSDPIEQLFETLFDKPQLKEKLYREYFVHSISMEVGKVIREREFNINDLQGDASKRITKVVDSFVPSLSIDDLSFKYPEVLQWCKGKKLLPEIGNLIGVQKKRKFFSLLSDQVISRPPEHLVSFLRKSNEEFNN